MYLVVDSGYIIIPIYFSFIPPIQIKINSTYLIIYHIINCGTNILFYKMASFIFYLLICEENFIFLLCL